MGSKHLQSRTILDKARTNILQLNYRNRHTIKLFKCMVCDTDDKEDIDHVMLHYIAYKEMRSHIIHFQQPYIERDKDILEHLLFDK